MMLNIKPLDLDQAFACSFISHPCRFSLVLIKNEQANPLFLPFLLF